MITFDAATHTYTDEAGNVLPSVTTILGEVGLIDTTWFKPEHAQRGTDVHEATAMVDRGEMDANDFPEWMHGYLDAWQLFKVDEGAKPEIIEQLVSTRDYAGTVDRVLTIGGNRWLVDIKTGRPSKWHPLQTAAYAIALGDADITRATVHITKDGKYRVKPHPNPADIDVWNALMLWRSSVDRYS